MNPCVKSTLIPKQSPSSISGRFLLLVIRNGTNVEAEGIKGRFLTAMEIESSTLRDDSVEGENQWQESRRPQA